MLSGLMLLLAMALLGFWMFDTPFAFLFVGESLWASAFAVGLDVFR